MPTLTIWILSEVIARGVVVTPEEAEQHKDSRGASVMEGRQRRVKEQKGPIQPPLRPNAFPCAILVAKRTLPQGYVSRNREVC